MNKLLDTLLRAGLLSPLSTGFARFIARKYQLEETSLLVQSAALVSECNQQGNVCVDLGHSGLAEKLGWAVSDDSATSG